MNPSETFVRQLFYSLGAVVLLAAVLYFAQVILVPFALAVLLAFLLNGPMMWLERRGLPRLASLPIVACVTFAALGLIGWVTAYELRQVVDQLPRYEGTVLEKFAPLKDLFERTQTLDVIGVGDVEKGEPNEANQKRGPNFQPSGNMLLEWLRSLLRPLLDVLAHMVLVVVLTVFILARREALRERFLRLVGHRHLTGTTRAMDEAAHRISRYLLLQATTNICMGLSVAGGLTLIGVPYAALWGLLAAALRFLPFVGIWIASLLPLLLSIAVFPAWYESLLVLGLFLALELVMANAIEPLLFGRGTGVSPLALLIVAVAWAWLWGPVGLLLSTPMTVCLVVLGRYVPSLRFLDLLLGDTPALAVSTSYYQRLLAGDEDEAAVVVQHQLEARPPELVFDELLLPALVQMRQGRGEHTLGEDEERAFIAALRTEMDTITLPEHAKEHHDGTPARPLRVIGCPLPGDANILALDMLGSLVRSHGHDLEQVPAAHLVEAFKAAEAAGARLVCCIAAVPPGGLSQTIALCKRARQASREVRLLVGRWGAGPETEDTARYLHAAGADQVATTLLQTVQQLNPESILQPA